MLQFCVSAVKNNCASLIFPIFITYYWLPSFYHFWCPKCDFAEYNLCDKSRLLFVHFWPAYQKSGFRVSTHLYSLTKSIFNAHYWSSDMFLLFLVMLRCFQQISFNTHMPFIRFCMYLPSIGLSGYDSFYTYFKSLFIAYYWLLTKMLYIFRGNMFDFVFFSYWNILLTFIG